MSANSCESPMRNKPIVSIPEKGVAWCLSINKHTAPVSRAALRSHLCELIPGGMFSRLTHRFRFAYLQNTIGLIDSVSRVLSPAVELHSELHVVK